MKMKAKPIPETRTQRQRDNHELTHLPPVPRCPACVSGIAADDPHRRRQDSRDSGLDVASFDHCDISAEVGMFNKKLKFKVFVSYRSGAVATLEGTKRRHGDVEFWCVCPRVSKRAGRDCSAERCCQDKAIQDEPEKHAQVFAWQFRSLKMWRNRCMQRCFKCTLITTANIDKFPAELLGFSGWLDMLRGRSLCAQS